MIMLHAAALRRCIGALCLAPSLLGFGEVSRDTDEIRCTYSRRSFCGAGGCKQIPITSDYLLSPDRGALAQASRRDGHEGSATVRRCDSKGCTPVEVQVDHDGAFLLGFSPQYMIKYYDGPNDRVFGHRVGDFVEVATMMLGVEISHGHCPFKVLER